MTDQDLKGKGLYAVKCGQDELNGDNDTELRYTDHGMEQQAPNQALVKECHYLDAFFQNSLIPLVLLDRNFNFIRVNEAYAKACQREINEFPGHNHFEFYPSEAKEIFESVVRTRQPFRGTARPFVFPDHPERGVTYWDWLLTPLFDEKGEVEALVFALKDVTMRIRAQIELEQHQKHLEEMVRERTRELETANVRLQAEIAERTEAERRTAYLASFPERNPNPIMEVDLEGHIRYANPAALSFFPDLPEQGSVHPWLAEWAEAVRPFRNGQNNTSARTLAIGARIYHQKLSYFAQDGIVRIYGMDITERKRAEEELLKTRADAERRAAELQTVLDAVPASVWMTYDPECSTIIGNRSSYKMLGLPFGANVSMSASKGERPEIFKVFKNGREMEPLELPVQRAARGALIQDFEFDIVFKDGSARHMLGNAVPLYDAAGTPKGAVAAFVDISEHMRTEAALRESEERYRALANELREKDRSKSNFLAVLSHELRNPLTAIHNSLHILERVTADSDSAERARAVIDRQFHQLSHLVNDLLDITRITQNKIRLQRRRIELNELVRQTMEDYQPQFDQNVVSLEAEFAPFPIFVPADRTRLAQAVGNLLQNAAKFTHEGGSTRVSVSCKRTEQKAVIRVADTGAGIPPKMLPTLFQPFMQADTTLDRGQGGLGLGLAIVKGIIDLHGGDVSVSSTNQGSEFMIQLPLDDSCADQIQAEPSKVSGPCRRILIIEDNVDLAESLRELLELSGHEIELAYSGFEGVAKARVFRPEVLLCDIGLPGMDGYAVARAFRDDENLRKTWRVALTGYAQPEDLQRSEEAGFDVHIAKPPDLAALERMLAQVHG